MQIDTANPYVRRWFIRITGGVPSKVSAVQMALTARWKADDARKLQYERKWGQLIYRVFSLAGQSVESQFNQTATTESALSVLDDRLLSPMREVSQDLFVEVGRDFGRRALQNFRSTPIKSKADDPFAVWDVYESPQAILWNRQRTASLIAQVAKTTRDLIRRIIQSALESGLATDRIARRLRDSFGFSRVRAFRIARTEINAASNAGSRFAVQTHVARTDTLVKVWLSTRDLRVRDSHAAANGQRRLFDEPYVVGSGRLMFPGDTSLGAPGKEIVGCRCTEYYLRSPQRVRPRRRP